MKVPPKRKGNQHLTKDYASTLTLNESPSEKEGKSRSHQEQAHRPCHPSMKVPPKRKGNPKGDPLD